jgi:hypothetical protein
VFVLRGTACFLDVAVPTTAAAHAAGAIVTIVTDSGVPFEGPYSLLDLPALGQSAALSNLDDNNVRDTIFKDGDVDMWDAPMPPSLVTVDIRGAGFIREVFKEDVYYLGPADSPASQIFPNPFYIVNIPDSPFIPAVVAGGGYIWDSWGNDGPGGLGMGVYGFWEAARVGSNIFGVGDPILTLGTATRTAASLNAELAFLRDAFDDPTIARTLVVYSDNHGEFMVIAQGDFNLDFSGCAINAVTGTPHCASGNRVGTSTITAVADYPDFRGKHYPLQSNTVTVNWTWGGFKDITIEPGPTPAFAFVVFHALDRDGFCLPPLGGVTARSVLGEEVDFLLDAGEGLIIRGNSFNPITGTMIDIDPTIFTTRLTFSRLANLAAGLPVFPVSPLNPNQGAGADECQAAVLVANTLLGQTNIIVSAHDPEGVITLDRIINFQRTFTYTLNFRWSLITWVGQDNIPVADALHGNPAAGANDIFSQVTAVYGWDAAAQQWLGFFPNGVDVPGANDLTALRNGSAYWIAITGPNAIQWTVLTTNP